MKITLLAACHVNRIRDALSGVSRMFIRVMASFIDAPTSEKKHCSRSCLSAPCIIQRLFLGDIIIKTWGGDVQRLTVEVEVLCNWFKVDAISPVLLKGDLKEISVGKKKHDRWRKTGRKRETRLFCCVFFFHPEGCVVSRNDRTSGIVRSAAY